MYRSSNCFQKGWAISNGRADLGYQTAASQGRPTRAIANSAYSENKRKIHSNVCWGKTKEREIKLRRRGREKDKAAKGTYGKPIACRNDVCSFTKQILAQPRKLSFPNTETETEKQKEKLHVFARLDLINCLSANSASESKYLRFTRSECALRFQTHLIVLFPLYRFRFHFSSQHKFSANAAARESDLFVQNAAGNCLIFSCSRSDSNEKEESTGCSRARGILVDNNANNFLFSCNIRVFPFARQ